MRMMTDREFLLNAITEKACTANNRLKINLIMVDDVHKSFQVDNNILVKINHNINDSLENCEPLINTSLLSMLLNS